MNQLSVQQRKMLYAAVAVLMILPIVVLGGPANQTAGSGWWLAQLRHKHELGEASLGNVDPTSATMNLVLLGLRGVAASVLWQQADHYKNTKNFNQLEQTVESIILLQPHFKTVWEFQAWNLAFNVSAECDGVEDRFHWVKRGAKFLIRGTRRNEKVPELKFETGRFFGQKIGRADERDAFREFFVEDPDVELWKGGPDEEINREGKDNYLVAADWYQQANDTLELKGVEQHKMDLALFLAYPYRSLMDYAMARQKDGIKADLDAMTTAERDAAYRDWSETTRSAWDEAYKQWTEIYGRRRILVAGPGGHIILEDDDATMRDLAESENMTFEDKKRWQDRYRKTTNYLYWKKRCEIERRETMMKAWYQIAEGRRLHRDVQDFDGARVQLEEGMQNLQSVIDLYDREDGSNSLLDDESDIVEEGVKALLVWQQTLSILGESMPEDFPLKRLWADPRYEDLRADLEARFQYHFGEFGGDETP